MTFNVSGIDVLVVDDEEDIRDMISDILVDEGFFVRTASGSEEAFKEIKLKAPQVIILDVWLQDSELDGLGMLEVIQKQYPSLPVIVISGHGTVDTAVTAIKMGAYDYLEKPFSHDKLLVTLKRTCENYQLKREVKHLRTKSMDSVDLIGNTQLMIKLKNEISRIAPTVGRVMITGPIGSGKDCVAKLIHKHSNRSNGNFFIFDPLNYKDPQYELFGIRDNNNVFYVNAELSGQKLLNTKKSLLEIANYGSLYIDEITNLSYNMQMKLLNFLKTQSFEKDNQLIKLDVRIISSTSKNIEEYIEKGLFSRDLYDRLNVMPIRVPSLSERKEDIILLVKYFAYQLSKVSNLKARAFSPEAIASLQSADWKGNIRQLRNTVELALIMNPPSIEDASPIKADMLPNNMSNTLVSNIENDNGQVDIMSKPLREAREFFERTYLIIQMNKFGGNISRAAKFIGMERSALHRKLKTLNIPTGRRLVEA